jgi:hypothetical protein
MRPCQSTATSAEMPTRADAQKLVAEWLAR